MLTCNKKALSQMFDWIQNTPLPLAEINFYDDKVPLE